jgi:hypothetical protein
LGGGFRQFHYILGQAVLNQGYSEIGVSYFQTA